VALDDAQDDAGASPLSLDERAAVRAFLQRCEVRLSTVHRVASALLSGAGLMVLLPAVERDSVVTVVRSLLTGRLDAVRLLLIVGITASLALPFSALWLVLRDLTSFYFHASHLRHASGETFVPRFTLTGLRLPADELGTDRGRDLDSARRDVHNVELLVPGNDAARRRIDRQIGAYDGLGVSSPADDLARAGALFELAAARPRALLDEVAKVEHGMTRHVLRVQAIVLRYVKALLALLTTAFATFAAAAVVEHPTASSGGSLDPGQELWLAAVLLAWSPAVVIAVTTPVRWLDRHLRSEGATNTGVANDPELTRIEGVTVRLAAASCLAATAAAVVILARDDVTDATAVWSILAITGGVAGLAMVLRQMRQRRLASRHTIG